MYLCVCEREGEGEEAIEREGNKLARQIEERLKLVKLSRKL